MTTFLSLRRSVYIRNDLNRFILLTAFTAASYGCFDASSPPLASETGNDPPNMSTSSNPPSDSDSSPTGGIVGELRGECPLDQRIGLFRVAHEPSYSSVDGEVNSGVVPNAVLEETFAEGGCRLLQRNNPFCDPPCATGQVCDHDGSCIDYPVRQQTGTVTVEGLEVEVVMEPKSDNRYFETALPQPAFSPEQMITLHSTGGDVDALALHGYGVTPIELEQNRWSIVKDEPLAITWVPAQGDNAEVYLTINVDQHGISPSTLVCSGPDTGHFDIPATVIDALLGSGISGFPVGHAYRRTVDSMNVNVGCVEFQVLSHIGATIDVEGHTACTGDNACPEGMTCDLAMQTCT